MTKIVISKTTLGMSSIGDIGIGIYDGEDDEDDEMLDLFSFGADDTIQLESTTDPSIPNSKALYKPPSGSNSDTIGGLSAFNSSAANDTKNEDNNSCGSDDSFIMLLENAQQYEISVLKDMGSLAIGNNQNNNDNPKTGSQKVHQSEDSDMRDFLDWLDDDDKKGSELLQRQEEELSFVHPPRPPLLKGSIPKAADLNPLPPKNVIFDTLEEAVMSPESSKSDIRKLLKKGNFAVSQEIRPHLWSKIVCEKTLEETLQSSLADSIQQWEQTYWKSCSSNENRQESFKSNNKVSNYQESPMNRQEKQIKWLEQQSNYLAERIITLVKDGDILFYRKALQAILRNHFNTGSETVVSNSDEEDDSSWKDPLVPPVLCAILSSGAPPPAACVMLSKIIPSFMPILALTTKERQEIAMILHRQFYFLACYHLPLLVLHLDNFVPDWHKCYPHGKIPQSWLISHLAGEIDGTFMNAKCLLHLWDYVLTTENNSLRFFLLIAILDRHAERLLLLTDNDLKEEFGRVLSFASDEDASNREPTEWVREWTHRATLLRDETPIAVTRKLWVLEDEAVTNSLISRQEAKVEKLRLQQEAEEKALLEAREAEKERKADEARSRLNRARLVAFYRQFNPGKENNIDKIMVSYEGRLEILDAKLKLKYGVSFNPALKQKPILLNKNNSKIFSTMNSGFGQFKSISKNNSKKQKNTTLQPGKKENAVVEVPASEVLPVVCWSKDSNRIKLSKLKGNGDGKIPLKFYIVDCREESATKEHGRLPTSVPFSLESTKRNKYQETFESLRGSTHICIMSEGYAALPQLYGDKMRHQMTSGLVAAITEEAERNRACARFFLSKGYPFVSVLEGGFASAHSYLCREGHKIHLNVNDVLIDYNPEVSLFGRFEKFHSMSRSEKAQRSLQNMFDSSITAITKHGTRLETVHNNSKNSSQSRREEADAAKHPLGAPTSPTKGRRPFSFGSLGIGQNIKRNETFAANPTTNKFAGSLKKFQKNTIARMQKSDCQFEENQNNEATTASPNVSGFEERTGSTISKA